jgi:hypothetical protein
MSRTNSAATSEGEKVPEIQVLTKRVLDLNQTTDWWNAAMIWALIFAALSAIAVVGTTMMALRRAKQAGDAQSELIQTKDAKLALDLRDRDVKIAQADLARAKIEESIAWRRLTEIQQVEIASSLRRFRGNTVGLWFSAGDKESETFAMEIAASLHKAQWTVFRPANRIDLIQAGLPFTDSILSTETGVSVSGPANESGHSIADALIRELTDRGFSAIRMPDSRRPKPDDAGFRIEVNVRPQGPQGEAKLKFPTKQ